MWRGKCESEMVDRAMFVRLNLCAMICAVR